MKLEPEFYLISFASASHCIESEKKARGRYKVHVVPTPREITASCGMALRFSCGEMEVVKGFFDGLDVPSQLYAFGCRGEGGRRLTEKLAER